MQLSCGFSSVLVGWLVFCRCATAYILLAEEEATTIVEAEKLFKQALKAGEGCYRRSQQLQHHGAQYEAQHSKFLWREQLFLKGQKFQGVLGALLFVCFFHSQNYVLSV